MSKNSVNLILVGKEEPEYLGTLKKVFPILAGISLFVFVIFFLSVLGYLNKNSSDFNRLQGEVSSYERKIATQKDTEGIYSVTASRLTMLDQILNDSNTFTKLLDEINKINSPSIQINTANADKLGNLDISLVASSSAQMSDFISFLLEKEEKGSFSHIFSNGVIREKNGNYHLSLVLKSDKSLLQ